MKARIAVAISVLAVLVATLHQSGETLAPGWTFSVTSGEGALAELIQNLLLFIPLGLSLTLAGVRLGPAVALGAGLSLSVEFVQQWIPGRDPSVGDIACNTASTALGVALVRFAPRWLLTPPDRSAWQALGTAAIAVLAWLGTAALLRPAIPAGGEHRVVTRPDFPLWSRYMGAIRSARLERGMLIVEAVAPSRPPRRRTPLAAVLDGHDTRLAILAVDRNDLSLRYHMPALRLTLQQPDLRWYGALATIRPGEAFTAAMGHDPDNVCLALNRDWRCGLGFRIGDGWKLIYYPEGWPRWRLTLINALWVAGCLIGVGFWGARGGERRRRAAQGAIALAILGMIVVPMVTDLNATSLWEWIGGLVGIEVGLALGSRSPGRRPGVSGSEPAGLG